MKKIWIVNYRVGTDMYRPDVCYSQEEAERAAEDFINSAAWDAWARLGEGDKPETDEELQEWAEDMGCVYTSTFFWSGATDGYEAFVSEHFIEDEEDKPEDANDGEISFNVSICDGEVFIDNDFVAQLCWDSNAVGSAIALWLDEKEAETYE